MGQLSEGGHLMLRAVADTHAVIWYLFADERLSATARIMIEEAAAGGGQIAFSSITLAEIVYLSEKGRVDPATLDRLLAAIDREDAVLVEVPLDRHVAKALRKVERTHPRPARPHHCGYSPPPGPAFDQPGSQDRTLRCGHHLVRQWNPRSRRGRPFIVPPFPADDQEGQALR
jgi:PIN domain nuclease of toxin-antitoxin system